MMKMFLTLAASALFISAASASDIKVYGKQTGTKMQLAAHVTGVSTVANHKTHESRKAKQIQGKRVNKSAVGAVHGRDVSASKVPGLSGDKHKKKHSKNERTKF